MIFLKTGHVHRLLQNKHILNRWCHTIKKRLFISQTSQRSFSIAAALWNKSMNANPGFDLSEYPPENIRNFSIIAHVDHGKSTLADRLLELTGVISKSKQNAQVLDRLQVEKERGITVKAQTASLFYTYKDTKYLINLIDTPGHVDFNYEVSRSLEACQGVILLVDANQGVQAQTVNNFFLAFEKDLAIIPVLNKIDLKGARPDVVIQQLKNLFDVSEEEVLKISAKHGTGVEEVLKKIVEEVPPPKSDVSKPLKCLVFDSWFKPYRGAVANVAVIDGCVRKGDKIESGFSKKMFEVAEVGIMYPEEHPTDILYAGQVGYLMCNMKSSDAMVGDTIYHKDKPVELMPGFKPARPMVFAGIFPSTQSEFQGLNSAIEKLLLNDSSVDVHVDHSAVLGMGWRLGFLGLLHMDVFTTRLDQEYGKSVIVTSPNVPYKVKIKGTKNTKAYHGDEVTVLNPCKLPDTSIITEFQEPMVNGTIISPMEYGGDIIRMITTRRGTFPEQTCIDDSRMMYQTTMPLNEILVDFFDELKQVTSGYASFEYDDAGYQITDLVKVDFLLNGKEVEELTLLCHTTRARDLGEVICRRLKENIPRQMFHISIQAAVGKRILCREDIRAFRKDVTAKCYGGDVTRKQKLLKAQAEGKKKMRMIGNIEIPKNAFIKIIKR